MRSFSYKLKFPLRTSFNSLKSVDAMPLQMNLVRPELLVFGQHNAVTLQAGEEMGVVARFLEAGGIDDYFVIVCQ